MKYVAIKIYEEMLYYVILFQIIKNGRQHEPERVHLPGLLESEQPGDGHTASSLYHLRLEYGAP